ncbi:hypothetical protein HYV87_02275 [Candidatus Woesearchaeota archaeon]|nr:hypothetical protein [Candidatus Woesearchaeota archaeon]
MKLDLSKLQISNQDRSRSITFPDQLTPELAELIGIMIGDGHIGRYKTENYTHYEIFINGNIRDKDYYENYVNPLIFKLFNIKFNIRLLPNENGIVLRKDSKGIYSFLSEVIGIPSRKDNVSVPACILDGSKEIKSSFLRGYSDADFCLMLKRKPKIYPIIQGTSKSKIAMIQCGKILEEFGIKNSVREEKEYYAKRKATYTKHRIFIYGIFQVNSFMEQIGFSNPKKYEKYKKSGPEGI